MGGGENPLPYANQSTMDLGDQLRQAFNLGGVPITQKPGPAAPSTRKFYSTHQGYDFGTPEGTPIKPNQSGQVVQSYYDPSGYGNRALVKFDNGESYYLSHLRNLPQAGAFQAGQPIAYTGGRPGSQGAGNTTGPHLDITPAGANAYQQIMKSVNSGRGSVGKLNLQALANIAKQKYGKGAIAVGSQQSLQKLMGKYPNAKLVKLT